LKELKRFQNLMRKLSTFL